MQEDIVYGRHPVLEALESGQTMDKIYIQEGLRHTQIGQIRNLAKEKGIVVRFADRRRLDLMSDGENHQGVIAVGAAHAYAELEDVLALARRRGEAPFVVIAEGITDPHNLGSILRTANAAGVHGVIIPKNRSVSLNATVAKVSAGAVEYTPVVRVTNITHTLERLKKEGLWIVGSDLSAVQTHDACDLTGALGLVIGSEGEGMSRLVRENCDFLVKIPMLGEIQSLNASVAAGVLMYEAVRQRTQEGK